MEKPTFDVELGASLSWNIYGKRFHPLALRITRETIINTGTAVVMRQRERPMIDWSYGPKGNVVRSNKADLDQSV